MVYVVKYTHTATVTIVYNFTSSEGFLYKTAVHKQNIQLLALKMNYQPGYRVFFLLHSYDVFVRVLKNSYI